MGRRHGLLPSAAGLLAATLMCAVPTGAQDGGNTSPPLCPCVGPPRGTILIAGGGDLPLAVYRTFVKLAGGHNARIVVIPTAGDGDRFPPDWIGLEPFLRAGARSVRVLHTRSRDDASQTEFVSPLASATGVWITGGRQWRLIDAYLGTRVPQELEMVLDRGGVVGGTSAGASVLASYLVRGSRDRTEPVILPGHDIGFGLLRGVAVDQHLIARQREGELTRVVDAYPQLIGIGLDEGAALVIQGDVARVEGTSLVGIWDKKPRSYPLPFRWLTSGDRYDLARRQRLPRPERERRDLPSTF